MNDLYYIKAKTLKDYRYLNGYTQEDLAKLSGLSRLTINKLEKGKCQPSVNTCKKLATAFNTSWTDLWHIITGENI